MKRVKARKDLIAFDIATDECLKDRVALRTGKLSLNAIMSVGLPQRLATALHLTALIFDFVSMMKAMNQSPKHRRASDNHFFFHWKQSSFHTNVIGSLQQKTVGLPTLVNHALEQPHDCCARQPSGQ